VRHVAGVLRTRADQQWHAPNGVVTLGTLNVRRLGLVGPPVVLLHGMCGSHQYLGSDFDVLAASSQLIVPDLLGFGKSPKPPSGYGPIEHAEAVAACLREANIDEPAIVVGHSLVALALMESHPTLVDSVIVSRRRSTRLGLMRAVTSELWAHSLDISRRIRQRIYFANGCAPTESWLDDWRRYCGRTFRRRLPATRSTTLGIRTRRVWSSLSCPRSRRRGSRRPTGQSI
jgi:pimeloyl-ACP methyl ester carboxylesterase